MINRLTHALIACACAIALAAGCAPSAPAAGASPSTLPRIEVDAPSTTAPTTTMRPTQGPCGGAPCNPNCNEDEVQVTADEGVRICFHIEGDGYRILP